MAICEYPVLILSQVSTWFNHVPSIPIHWQVPDNRPCDKISTKDAAPEKLAGDCGNSRAEPESNGELPQKVKKIKYEAKIKVEPRGKHASDICPASATTPVRSKSAEPQGTSIAKREFPTNLSPAEYAAKRAKCEPDQGLKHSDVYGVRMGEAFAVGFEQF